MKASKPILALMVVVALASLSVVQGQYGTANTYSSFTPVPGPASYAASQYGQYNPISTGRTDSLASGYLSGTVLSIKDENSTYVNFINSSTPGMEGPTLYFFSCSYP